MPYQNKIVKLHDAGKRVTSSYIGINNFIMLHNFIKTITFIAALSASIMVLSPNMLSEHHKNFILHITLWITVPFLLFTVAKTKITWYILPIFPALAISIGTLSSVLLKHKNRNLLIQAMLSFIMLISIYRSEESIVKNIMNPKVDRAQELLKSLKDMPEYRGKKIYIHHFEQSYWLCAEFYSDLIPVDGGLEGFLKDASSKTLFFSTKDRKDIPAKEISNLKVVAENEVAYLLTK